VHDFHFTISGSLSATKNCEEKKKKKKKKREKKSRAGKKKILRSHGARSELIFFFSRETFKNYPLSYLSKGVKSKTKSQFFSSRFSR
jgi:hypothetical protein